MPHGDGNLMRNRSSGYHFGQCWLMQAKHVLFFSIVAVKKLVVDSVSAAKLECAVPHCVSVKEAVPIMKMVTNKQIYLTASYCFLYIFGVKCAVLYYFMINTHAIKI